MTELRKGLWNALRQKSHRIHAIYANMFCILMVNVTIYSIHGFYGYGIYELLSLRKMEKSDVFGCPLSSLPEADLTSRSSRSSLKHPEDFYQQ